MRRLQQQQACAGVWYYMLYHGSMAPPTKQERHYRFPTTKWSLVAAAGLADSEARAALEELCEIYWYPLYVFVRHRHGAEEAQDLVQGFFARFLERDYFKNLQADAGRFRSYLLAAVKHYISNELTHRRAEKRGGGKPPLPLSVSIGDGEHRYQHEPAVQADAESVFEERWALALLDNALERLREEYRSRDKTSLYQELKQFLPGGEPGYSYDQLAVNLGMSKGAARVAVHRLRSRYADAVRAEVAATLTDVQDVDEEIRYLVEILSRPGS